MVRRVLSSLLVSVLALSASDALAGDGAPTEGPDGLRGPRVGFTPGIGVGFAAFTGSSPFSSVVATTALQIEGLFELERWGFFLRGGFLSAGPTGLWSGPVLAAGAQYRLRGDGEEHWGFVVRGGAIYERWSAAQGGCEVLYVIPNGCQNFVQSSAEVPSTPLVSITADAIGLLAAFRLEVPVEPVYVAFDAELSGAADVDQSAPGAIFTGELVLTFALRDHVRKNNSPQRFRRRF